MRVAERERDRRGKHQITPLELFFDLVFVFDHPGHEPARGRLDVGRRLPWDARPRGALVGVERVRRLTSAMDVDEGGVRLVMLASMGTMFGVALAVPGAFEDDAVLFGVAYLLVRLLHLALSAIVGRDDPARLGALLRFAPTAVVGASLLVLAGFLEGNIRIAVWVSRLRSTTSARPSSGLGAAGVSSPSISPSGTG